VHRTGRERNSLRSDNVHFFIRPAHRLRGSVKAEFQQPSQIQQHSPSVATALVCFDFAVVVVFDVNPWRSAEELTVQAEREVNVV
jgi:hypothetical protein